MDRQTDPQKYNRYARGNTHAQIHTDMEESTSDHAGHAEAHAQTLRNNFFTHLCVHPHLHRWTQAFWIEVRDPPQARTHLFLHLNLLLYPHPHGFLASPWNQWSRSTNFGAAWTRRPRAIPSGVHVRVGVRVRLRVRVRVHLRVRARACVSLWVRRALSAKWLQFQIRLPESFNHLSRYFFSVKNNTSQQGLKVRFNIVNFTKKDSLYNHGMRPAVYSCKANNIDRFSDSDTFTCNLHENKHYNIKKITLRRETWVFATVGPPSEILLHYLRKV